jgi:hypothetical protein
MRAILRSQELTVKKSSEDNFDFLPLKLPKLLDFKIIVNTASRFYVMCSFPCVIDVDGAAMSKTTSLTKP